jgi:hypothetical protein
MKEESKMDDYSWGENVYDGYDESEDEINLTSDEILYNHDYKKALVKCDKRVDFNDQEKSQLDELNKKLTSLIDLMIKKIEMSVELDEMEKDEEERRYYKEVKNLEVTLRTLETEANKIQLIAEDRFMKERFNNDVLLIINDAIDVLDKQKDNHVNLMVKALLSKETNFVMIEMMYDSILSNIRMHANYLSMLKETKELGVLIAIKIKDLIATNPDNDKIIVNVLSRSLFKEKLEKLNIKPASGFEIILQGTLTGWLSTLNSTGKTVDIDYAYGRVKMIREGLTVYLENHTESNLDVVTLQFIDILIVEFNEKGRNDSKISITLESYMEKRGITATNKARDQIKRIFNNLNNMRLEYNLMDDFKIKKTKQRVYKMKILSEEGTLRKSIITVKLDDDFCTLIKGFKIMQLPSKIYTFSEKENPHSYYLLKKIAWHKNINFKHSNQDTITVKKLLEVCPRLPDYESIAKTGQIKQRIIDPFTRDMNAFSDVLTWDYYQNDVRLSKDQASTMDYDSFTKLKIKVNWLNFPIKKVLDSDTLNTTQ